MYKLRRFSSNRYLSSTPNQARRSRFLLQGNEQVPIPDDIYLLEGIDILIAEGVGVLIGNNAYTVQIIIVLVRNVGVGQLASTLPRMQDKQSANLVVTSSVVQRTVCVQRAMNPERSPPACQREGDSAMRMLEHLLELPGTAG